MAVQLPSLTGGAGGAATATGGTVAGPSPFNDGAMNVSFAPSVGLGLGSGTSAGLPSWVWIAAAVGAAIYLLRRRK